VFRLTPPVAFAGLAILLLGARPAEAQCTIDTTVPAAVAIVSTPTAPLGQSFTACQSGIVTNIAIIVSYSTRDSLLLGLQRGTDLTAPELTQLTTWVQGARRVRFTPSFPVTGGMTYSFSIAPLVGILNLGMVDGYPDGSLLQVDQGVTVVRNGDMEFSLTISPEPVVPARVATWGRLKATYR
jgi:hypothetical protein